MTVFFVYVQYTPCGTGSGGCWLRIAATTLFPGRDNKATPRLRETSEAWKNTYEKRISYKQANTSIPYFHHSNTWMAPIKQLLHLKTRKCLLCAVSWPLLRCSCVVSAGAACGSDGWADGRSVRGSWGQWRLSPGCCGPRKTTGKKRKTMSNRDLHEQDLRWSIQGKPTTMVPKVSLHITVAQVSFHCG